MQSKILKILPLLSLVFLLSACAIKNITPVINNVHFKEIRLDQNKLIAYISIDVYNKSSLAYDIRVAELNIHQGEKVVAFLDEPQTYRIEKKAKNVLTVPLNFNQDAVIVNVFQLLQNRSLKLKVLGKGQAIFKTRSQNYSFNQEIELNLDMLKNFLFKQ